MRRNSPLSSSYFFALALVALGIFCTAGIDAWNLHGAGVRPSSIAFQVGAGAAMRAVVATVAAALLLAVAWWSTRHRARRWGRALAAGAVLAASLWPWCVVQLHDSPYYDTIRAAQQRRLDLALGLGLWLAFFAVAVALGPTIAPRLRRGVGWFAGLLFHVCILAAVLGQQIGSPSRPPAQTAAPNVVLIVFDTLRADALGYAGNELVETPTLDALAGRGLWLDGMVANGPVSLPGHASLLTGRGVHEHGALTNAHSMKHDVPTLAEELRQRGYRTAGVCRNQLISEQSGFARGFDSYWSTDQPVRGEAPLGLVLRRLPLVRIVSQLRREDPTTAYGFTHLSGERPFFLFAQYLTCHTPYEDRYGWATAERIARIRERYDSGAWPNRTEYPNGEVAEFHARYLGAVHTADRIVEEWKRELASRGLLENTVLIVTSDHGENLAEHGHTLIGHHSGPYETVLRIPLVAAGATVPQGMGRVRSLTGQDRVADLVLALANGPVGRETLGDVLRKRRHFAFVETHAILYDDSLKTVVDLQRPELGGTVYRWRTDPLDARPVSLDPDSLREREASIESILERNRLREALREAGELTPERERALRALGYIE